MATEPAKGPEPRAGPLSPEVIRRRSELRAVVDATPDLVSVRDPRGVYRMCNEAFARRIGLAPRDVVGRTDRDLFGPEEARSRCEQDRASLGGELMRREAWKTRPDGHAALFDTLEAPFYNMEGELLGVVEIGRDITRRHEMEEELRESAERLRRQFEQLEELEELRDSLTHMIVHDLRSPLTGITASLQLLEMEEEALGPDLLDDVRRALRNAARLVHMVNGVLDVSRMESGEMLLDIGGHDMTETARCALESLGALTLDRDVTLDSEASVRADFDAAVMERVLANLISNALRATSAAGEVRIAVLSGDRCVRVEVRDTGEGIPAEHHERIFQKFGRVERGRRESRFTSGLGLAFCKMAIDAHRGRIGLESVVGEGSTFWIELPADPSEA